MCNFNSVFSLIWTASFILFSASFVSPEWFHGMEVSACPDANTHCVSIKKCQEFIDRLASDGKKNLPFLINVKCGFDGKTPKVCCPIRKNLIDCRIDGMEGSCRDEEDCPGLWRFDAEKTEKDIFFNSKCKEKTVCCPKTTQTCVATNLPNPRRECCGIDVPTERISGGNSTAVDQYPWTVIVKYKEPKTMCGGSLISGRYVLTAAHCVYKDYSGEIDHVVAGEYDTEHPGPDCEDRGGLEYCTDGETRIKVAKAIIHPYYSFDYNKNDIAVLQLAKMAKFTDFVQPVCLPSTKAFVDDKKPMFVMGWGAVNLTIPRSNVKLAAKVKHIDINKCSSALDTKLNKMNLCAKGVRGAGACAGDSGGALVRYNGKNFELAGIHSFGTVRCGTNYPGVYANVAEYLDWINEVMEREQVNIQPWNFKP